MCFTSKCHQSSDLHTKQRSLAAGFKAYYPTERSEFVSYEEQRYTKHIHYYYHDDDDDDDDNDDDDDDDGDDDDDDYYY